jgi:hypothetical protein
MSREELPSWSSHFAMRSEAPDPRSAATSPGATRAPVKLRLTVALSELRMTWYAAPP